VPLIYRSFTGIHAPVYPLIAHASAIFPAMHARVTAPLRFMLLSESGSATFRTLMMSNRPAIVPHVAVLQRRHGSARLSATLETPVPAGARDFLRIRVLADIRLFQTRGTPGRD